MKSPTWIKPAFWGVLVGAAAWWGVLAWGFGWVSASKAQDMTAQQVKAAVVAVAAPYCVSKFEQQPNVETSWQALKKSSDSFDQASYIKKGSFIVLPAKNIDPDTASAVADACATDLLALKEINGVKLVGLKS